MPEGPLAPTLVGARIGRTDLGQAALTVDDDALNVLARNAPDERTIRVELASIEGVYVDGNEVTVPLRDGTRLVLVADWAPRLRETILGRCMTLPELTRTLRVLGSRRGTHATRAVAAEEQRRFFAPLLDARRLATNAHTADDAITAFDADALMASIHRVLHAFAAQRFADLGPARRALEAELLDAVEPLNDSLGRVRDAAPRARSVAGELRPWRLWASELRAAFETADHVWLALDMVLESAPIPAAKGTAHR
ncbi:MAG TPA: hypothetical protein VHV78_01690 [Gemmatimonadaceae bacterium]|jgi:hypothetical protein|nr:hypothetical protein [Gemmatimonadaceae bacterium]